MDLKEAIVAVLAALDAHVDPDPEAVDCLRQEVEGINELWAVQTIATDEQPEPDRIEFGTAAEMIAWGEGFDYANGWNDPTTFSTEEDALYHCAEWTGGETD